jgi:hypothetical protein
MFFNELSLTEKYYLKILRTFYLQIRNWNRGEHINHFMIRQRKRLIKPIQIFKIFITEPSSLFLWKLFVFNSLNTGQSIS